MNEELVQYIENEIFPKYDKNEEGHGINHIKIVIKRSLELAKNNIKTLYFRDTNLVKLEENKYIKEVNNWGDIYRFIRNEEK